MSYRLLHPISFRDNRKLLLFAVIFAAFCVFSIYFALGQTNLKYLIQRHPLVEKIENYEYKLRSEPEVKKTDNPSQIYQTPGEYTVLTGAKWIPQTFNNCGPATVSMLLQYFGYNVSQEETKAALRTNQDDKNVFTQEIADYLKKEYALESRLLYNGNITTIKTLLTNGIYVVVEDWLHPNEDIGHTTILRGFDDKKQVFISDDSYLGTNVKYPYKEFDENQWKPFNREYLPVFKPEQEKLVKAIIGENWDERVMFENAVKKNKGDTDKNQNDMYAWFNLGTSYFGLSEYDEARKAFEKAKSLGWPKRMLWYQIQPIQTYNKLGEYDKALGLAKEGLWANDSFAELHYESAFAHISLGKKDNAKEELQKALFYYPNYLKAQELLKKL